jgi:hypothetical protein
VSRCIGAPCSITSPALPALDCASLHGRDQSLPQRLPGLVKTHCATMFAQLDVLVTIPIDDRHCFTHRFSPTGFILNASNSNCCRPIALARIQVKTYPFNSILRKVECGPCWYIEYTRSAIFDIRAAAIVDNSFISGVNFALVIAGYPIYEICSLNS